LQRRQTFPKATSAAILKVKNSVIDLLHGEQQQEINNLPISILTRILGIKLNTTKISLKEHNKSIGI
jgi:hypothetical protein